MQEAKPSRTAMRVAIRRAAHQSLDNPRVLHDPIAVPILGPAAAAQIEPDRDDQTGKAMKGLRAFLVARSRLAEDELARAVERGTEQYVILGAGLDTFAYRNPHPKLRVFEVDYSSTQEWKRQRLEAAGIAIPLLATFAPVDFERQTLAEGLREAGFDANKPTFFSWLGVTMYLTEDAIMTTLEFAGLRPAGGGIVFDYAVPPSSLRMAERIAFEWMARRVAAAGEPFRTFFDPNDLIQRMKRIGFRAVESFAADEINERYFKDRTDGLRVTGSLGRLMKAET